jgi:type 1 glutamine amidotransferase
MVRVLIITGQGNHDWGATTPFLRRILVDSGRFEVRVCEAPSGLTARTLADFDTVIDDLGGTGPGSETEQAIAEFVRSGKGLVVTHGALASPSGLHSHGLAHRSVHFLEVKTIGHDHPIVQGLTSTFRIADATYRGLELTSGAEVLATERDEEKDGGKSISEPILIASRLGKGRVVTMALGHDLAAMQDPWFITTFVRGTEWSATGEVTTPTQLHLSRPKIDPVKGLLITGGHEHEASFYSLFDGQEGLARIPVVSSSTAFRSDLRGKYDSLIMYDFTRDLDDAGKKNLRDFVEGGGGVVVLHHALLNYQQWPWWYEEAVGGSYRLKTEGKVPSSTVKDREPFFVTSDRQHPITARLDPFHIIDEAYKRMWISPRVQPLLFTDSPNSDRLVGWVGPSAGFRVVAIQLGHGPAVFSHPTYRALVHNAILWSAGRIR